LVCFTQTETGLAEQFFNNTYTWTRDTDRT